MTVMELFSSPLGQVLVGDILMTGCFVFYLAWWIAAFMPGRRAGRVVTVPLLATAVVSGLASLAFILNGLAELPHGALPFRTGYIIIIGIAAYLVLLTLTRLIFNRQLTSELILIVGWAMLTFSEINILYGADEIDRNSTIALAVISAAAVAVSLVCYVLYYRLGEKFGYVNGMIPLVSAAAIMTALSICTAI